MTETSDLPEFIEPFEDQPETGTLFIPESIEPTVDEPIHAMIEAEPAASGSGGNTVG